MPRPLLAALALCGAAFAPSIAAAEAPPAECTRLDPGKRYPVALDGRVDVRTLARWGERTFCRTVVLPSRVVDSPVTVEVRAPARLTPAELYQVFTASLRALNLTVEEPKGKGRGPILIAPGTGFRPSSYPMDPRPRELGDPFRPPGGVVVGDRVKCERDGAHCTIARGLVDEVLQNPVAVSGSARIIPSFHDGKCDGFKLYAIRPETVFDRLGFRNGDTVTSVNGLPLTSPEQALEAYSRVRGASHWSIAIMRRGSPTTVDVSLQ